MQNSNLPPSNAATEATASAGWRDIVARYQKPDSWRGLWQIANTLLPYAGLWFLMYLVLPISFWLAVPLAVLAAGFVVRTFIIFHDCGHGSFFASKRANEWVGFLTGVLTFSPSRQWAREHAIHHATSGDLDRRGTGDIWTLTVQEYLEASRWRRFAYRLARNPVILFVIAPFFVFVIKQRFVGPKAGERERRSVFWTNIGIVCMAAGLSWLLGLKAYLLIQLIVMGVAGSTGVWLFYVQHQFDGVYWERGDEWDYTAAALQGSSFYKLPKILQWFSGNIGYHHIHHLSARIPNYHLERCHQAHLMFQNVKPVTLFASLKSFTFRLWDEQRHRLIGYADLRAIRRQRRQASRS